MRRCTSFTIALLVAASAQAFAQGHPTSHPMPSSHDHGKHTPADSAAHAAMHALLHGSWSGVLTSSGGTTSPMTLSIALDSVQRLTVTTTAGDHGRAHAAHDVVVERNELRWTEQVAGKSCKATATLPSADSKASDTLAGKVSCDDGERSFALRRTAG
jgi:hypothetical protein